MRPNPKYLVIFIAAQLFPSPNAGADLAATKAGIPEYTLPELADSIGLANAIDNAERVTGGRAVKARLLPPDFHITVTATGGEAIEVVVDASSGSTEFEEVQAP